VSKREQAPVVLWLWSQIALVLCLAAFLAGVIILYDLAKKGQIYEAFFTYQASIRIFHQTLPTVAPFFIIPTLLAVCIGLWWTTLESTLRRMQPYLSMTKAPTAFSKGIGLSYQSTYLVWTAVRSAINKHWLLCLVALGATFSQVCKFAIFKKAAMSFFYVHGWLVV
jgi:hypothetical protein